MHSHHLTVCVRMWYPLLSKMHSNQVCVEHRTSALNMTLPAAAASLQLSINSRCMAPIICCLCPGCRQLADVDWWDRQTVQWTSDRYINPALTDSLDRQLLELLQLNLIKDQHSNSLCLLICICVLPSVLWHCRLGGTKGIRPVKNEWWGAGVVVCLEWDADLHTAQLMPLPLTVSCFSKIQIGFTFLVPAHQGRAKGC